MEAHLQVSIPIAMEGATLGGMMCACSLKCSPPKQGQSAAEGGASMNQIYSNMLKSLALISSGQV